jgi:hypothetical protein
VIPCQDLVGLDEDVVIVAVDFGLALAATETTTILIIAIVFAVAVGVVSSAAMVALALAIGIVLVQQQHGGVAMDGLYVHVYLVDSLFQQLPLVSDHALWTIVVMEIL